MWTLIGAWGEGWRSLIFGNNYRTILNLVSAHRQFTSTHAQTAFIISTFLATLKYQIELLPPPTHPTQLTIRKNSPFGN